MLVFKKGKIKQIVRACTTVVYLPSAGVFAKGPSVGRADGCRGETAAEETTEAGAPRAWGRLRARCPPLPHLGDTPLRSVVPASAGAKSMDGYAGREGQTELGRKTAAAAPPTAGRRLVYACSSDVPL